MDWRYIKKQKKDKEKWERENRARLEGTVQCEYCGHKNLIPADVDCRLCTWCKRTVWNHTKNHFIRKMKTLLNKQKKEEEKDNGRT